MAAQQQTSPPSTVATSPSLEYLRNIPYVKEDATVEEWNVAYRVIGSILTRNRAKQFLSMTKHPSLPDTEIPPAGGPVHTPEQTIAVDKHSLALHVLVLACQKNLQLSAFLQATETTDWPGGEVHEFIVMIEKYFKLTITTNNQMKQEIKKEEMLEAIQWGRNENPQDIWRKMAALDLRFQITSPISETDKIKWIVKNAPTGYDDTIKNAPMKLCQENRDWAYTATYTDFQNEVNEKYESFKKATKKRAELSLLTSGGRGDQGGRGRGRNGGRGGKLSRKQQSARDKAKNKKNESSTQSGNQVCYYCGEEGHYKNNCEKFATEKDQLFCTHCDCNGHDDHTCVKLHPDIKPQMTKGIRKLNKFGRSEHNLATINDSDDDDVDLNLMCIILDQDNKDDSKENTVTDDVTSNENWDWSLCSEVEDRKDNYKNASFASKTCDTCGNDSICHDQLLCEQHKNHKELTRYIIEEDLTLSSDDESYEIIEEVNNESTKVKNFNYDFALANMKAPIGLPSRIQLLTNPNIMIADTGSTDNTTGSALGAFNVKKYGGPPTKTATNQNMPIKSVFDFTATITDRYGFEKETALFKNFKFIPSAKYTLVAINKYMLKGWKLEGDSTMGLRLSKSGKSVTFDLPIYTSEGVLFTLHAKRRNPKTDSTEHEISCFSCKYTYQQAHKLLGHTNEEFTRATAKHLNWDVKGKWKVKCEGCGIGHARQKNLGEGTDKPEKIGDMWYIDGTSIKRTNTTTGPFPSNHFATMLIEALSGTGVTGWFDKKSGFIPIFLSICDKFRDSRGFNFKVLRCDGAGENKSFVSQMNGKDWKFRITPQYTPRATPQQNTGVETPIKVCHSRARSLQASANIPKKYRNIMYPPAMMLALQLQGLEIIEVNNVKKTRIEHLLGKLPAFTKYRLHVYGEAAVIKIKKEHQPKTDEFGITVIFVCYSANRPGDCYCFFHPKTLKTYHSRDVTWLSRPYFQPSTTKRGSGVVLPEVNETNNPNNNPLVSSDAGGEYIDDSDDEDYYIPTTEGPGLIEESEDEEIMEGSEHEEDETEVPVIPTVTTRSGRQVQPRRRLIEEMGNEVGLSSFIPRGLISEVGLSAIIAGESPGVCHDQDIQQVIDATDLLLDDSYSDESNEEEFSMFAGSASVIDCPSIVEEEYILAMIGQVGDNSPYIENMYGYTNKRGDYFMVAAVIGSVNDNRLNEYSLVGATGTNYGTTSELQVLNYKQAMKSVNQTEWLKAIKVEHNKMIKYNVFEVVHKDDVPKGTKVVDYAWAMKKKPSGVYRARLAARGFKQEDGVNYSKDDKSSPVITDMSINICMVLIILAGWGTRITDVEGAFLNGSFQKRNQKVYTTVPPGLKSMYPPWVLLLLLATMYGTIQGALQWFREMVKALTYLQWIRNTCDPCLHYKWIDDKLVVFLLWVDDCLVAGPEEVVIKETTKFRELYDTTDEGIMDEYVGCSIERTDTYLKLTQPVKIQRLIDEFGYDGSKALSTPVKPGSVLAFRAIDSPKSNAEDTKKLPSVIGMMLHVVRHSRPDCMNPTRELSSHMSNVVDVAVEHMDDMCHHVVATKDRGVIIAPDNPGSWNGTRDYLFIISGESDADWAKDPTRKSINSGCTFLNGAMIKMFSNMMKVIALSSTESELNAAVLEAMDMMLAYYIMKGMRLTVELPMKLYVDNKGSVEIANNWSVGGRTRHIGVKTNFLRSLKEMGFIHILYKKGTSLLPDIGTKNVTKKEFIYNTNKIMRPKMSSNGVGINMID